MAHGHINWRRIAAMAACVTFVTASASAGWMWHAARNAPRMPSGLATEDARMELDADIALLNHYGVTVSSLAEHCGAASPDAIQAFEQHGMWLLSDAPMAVSVRGNRVTTVRLHLGFPHPPKYPIHSSTVDADHLHSILAKADRMMKTTSPASTYEDRATDAGEIAIEMCRSGRYAFVERYMGTHDPDNQVLYQFNDHLWRLSREAQ